MSKNTAVTAQKIVEKIFEETNRVVQMNISSMSDLGIASILAGLVGFFIAGYRNDFDLSQEITPQFQKRIMQKTDKASYDNYSFQLNDAYTKFRECAISHQYASENWTIEMFEDFGEMLLKMLNANATQYSKELMVEEAHRLLDIAVKTEVATVQHQSTSNPNTKGRKLGKIVVGVLILVVIVGYYYIHNFHSQVHPEGLYYMQEYLSDDGEHYDCFIKTVSSEKNGKTQDYFNIYLIHYMDDSGEYMPSYCYMTSAPCGYWEWKKLLGSLAVNNAGNKYGIVQDGYARIDCYCAEGKSVAFDWFLQELDTSEDDLQAMIETIDFGTNNFVYQGTVFNKVNESSLDEDTLFYINTLEEMMGEAQ